MKQYIFMFTQLVNKVIFWSLFLLFGFLTWTNATTTKPEQGIENLIVNQNSDCNLGFNARPCNPFSLDGLKVNTEDATISSLQKKSKYCALVNLLFLFIEDNYIQVKYNTSCIYQFKKPAPIDYYIYGLEKILI